MGEQSIALKTSIALKWSILTMLTVQYLGFLVGLIIFLKNLYINEAALENGSMNPVLHYSVFGDSSNFFFFWYFHIWG